MDATKTGFVLHAGTAVVWQGRGSPEKAVQGAAKILARDLFRRFSPSELPKNEITLALARRKNLEPESFWIEVTDSSMAVYAGDDLGFVYGLLFISERFLGIRPFWFWMDQEIEAWLCRHVAPGTYRRPAPAVRFRGWFLNDEVLLDHWSVDGDPELPWRMALEALLRCGGNMVIPGTGSNSHRYRKLAADMGLWITHHHAEPLGAELFSRAYPDLEADYSRYPELFRRLWERGVMEQKDRKVVWTLGFRGQADMPFWTHDMEGRYDTDEKRGALISEVIELQRRIVRRHVKAPVFCTNLYGEIMELYAAGHITLSEEIIPIFADNGFGKMVSRRQGNHDPRIPSLPLEPVPRGGVYYHVSFYDLQAANHITMFPNTVEFVNHELDQAIEKNAVDYWIINCSNVRPHVYFLDALRKKWQGEAVSDHAHSAAFSAAYFDGSAPVANALRTYATAMLPFGPLPDQHAGEQFYTENPRALIHFFFHDREKSAPDLRWLTGDCPLAEQAVRYSALCRENLEKITAFYQECQRTSDGLPSHSKRLFDATVLLHASIHLLGTRGAAAFGDGFAHYENGDHWAAFMAFGAAAECFLEANQRLRDAEYGVWQGFYANDCLADCKHTAFLLQKLMGVMRELGDNSSHDNWYREAVLPPEERRARTILTLDNHMTDWDLYLAFKGRLVSEAV